LGVVSLSVKTLDAVSFSVILKPLGPDVLKGVENDLDASDKCAENFCVFSPVRIVTSKNRAIYHSWPACSLGRQAIPTHVRKPGNAMRGFAVPIPLIPMVGIFLSILNGEA
jgi:hypothetical protein